MRTHFETPPVFGCSLRLYTHDGIKFYAGRKDKNGLEDCAELRIKSDHYDVRFAEENDNVFICPQHGTEFRGRGGVTGLQMYRRHLEQLHRQAADDDFKANTAKLAG